MANVKNVAPGVGLCAAIALPCWFLGEALPVVGGPVFAILIGMVIALDAAEAQKAIGILTEQGERATVIGRVTDTEGVVIR